jgi:predicted nucleotidyltransferase
VRRRRSEPTTIEGIARRFGLRLIVRFGSTVSGRANAESDFDVAVRSRTPRRRRTLAWHGALEAALERVLDPGRPVDLVVLDGDTDPVLLFAIAAGGEPIWEGEAAGWARFCSEASRRFDDARRLIEARRRRLEALYG